MAMFLVFVKQPDQGLPIALKVLDSQSYWYKYFKSGI